MKGSVPGGGPDVDINIRFQDINNVLKCGDEASVSAVMQNCPVLVKSVFESQNFSQNLVLFLRRFEFFESLFYILKQLS